MRVLEVFLFSILFVNYYRNFIGNEDYVKVKRVQAERQFWRANDLTLRFTTFWRTTSHARTTLCRTSKFASGGAARRTAIACTVFFIANELWSERIYCYICYSLLIWKWNRIHILSNIIRFVVKIAVVRWAEDFEICTLSASLATNTVHLVFERIRLNIQTWSSQLHLIFSKRKIKL